MQISTLVAHFKVDDYFQFDTKRFGCASCHISRYRACLKEIAFYVLGFSRNHVNFNSSGICIVWW